MLGLQVIGAVEGLVTAPLFLLAAATHHTDEIADGAEGDVFDFCCGEDLRGEDDADDGDEEDEASQDAERDPEEGLVAALGGVGKEEASRQQGNEGAQHHANARGHEPQGDAPGQAVAGGNEAEGVARLVSHLAAGGGNDAA